MNPSTLVPQNTEIFMFLATITSVPPSGGSACPRKLAGARILDATNPPRKVLARTVNQSSSYQFRIRKTLTSRSHQSHAHPEKNDAYRCVTSVVAFGV
jgi:hypothetical protein